MTRIHSRQYFLKLFNNTDICILYRFVREKMSKNIVDKECYQISLYKYSLTNK